jgi:hypothetical protein
LPGVDADLTNQASTKTALFTDTNQTFVGYSGSQEVLDTIVDDMTRRVLSEVNSRPEAAQRPDDYRA